MARKDIQRPVELARHLVDDLVLTEAWCALQPERHRRQVRGEELGSVLVHAPGGPAQLQFLFPANEPTVGDLHRLGHRDPDIVDHFILGGHAILLSASTLPRETPQLILKPSRWNRTNGSNQPPISGQTGFSRSATGPPLTTTGVPAPSSTKPRR